MSQIATVVETIRGSADVVWNALVDPLALKRWMMGADVESDWTPGSDIVWKGVWNGRAFEDHGLVKRVEPPRLLEYTFVSGSDPKGRPHGIRFALDESGDTTRVTLTQDANATEEERAQSESMWKGMLGSLKSLVERERPREDVEGDEAQPLPFPPPFVDDVP